MPKVRIQDNFHANLQAATQRFNDAITAPDGDWAVRGFIDVFRNIYTISNDTKVVSKLIELMLFPQFMAFATAHGYKVILSQEQNHYPDLTFIDVDGNKFAVDLKSTYRISATQVNTMTLGAFTGYFRNRTSSKNCTFPYGEYVAHFVLGVVYTRSEIPIDELKVHHLDDLPRIPSVVRDLRFFAQPKWKIAKDQPGSGNTKNIGAIGKLEDLVEGRGPFAALGEDVFDDYWMYYLTRDMARAVDLDKPPYNNLGTYLDYKNLQR